MVEEKVTVTNKTGLHARPAALVSAEGNKFKCNIFLKKADRTVNIKSLLGVLSLAVKQGDEIIIRAEGEDEKEAVESVKNLIYALNEY